MAAIAMSNAEDVRKAYDRATHFGSEEMPQLVYMADVQANWIGSSHRFWYRRDVRGEREFVLIDADKGTRVPAFDHNRLASALSKVAGSEFKAKALPFTSISFSDDGATISFGTGSGLWKCDLKTYECTRTEAAKTAPPPDTVFPPEPPDRPNGEASPDGKWTASIRDCNIILRANADGKETPLTTDGKPENAYGRLQWSPDSHYLTAWRTQPGEHGQMYNVESSPEGTLRPKLKQYTYDLPGDRLDTHVLWIVDVANGKAMKADVDAMDWGDPSLIIMWRPDSRHFRYGQLYRGYQRMTFVEVDAATGKSRLIVDERSNTFIWPLCLITTLDASDEILWMSSRDGWRHLYLIDGATATAKQITKGPWVVRNVEDLDPAARTLLFTASGREAGEDPYLIHYYRINLDGTGLVSLTPGNGQHTVRFSPDKTYYTDTYSRVDAAPITELRKTVDGSLVMPLEQADVKDLLATGWKWPEPFVAKGRDGTTDIWGVIYRPSNFNRKKKYPVIEDIYAGPQDSFVPKTFDAHRGDQAMAELGFIVVQMDGMGTGNRSKAFYDVCYKNLGDSGFPDRIAWMKAAAAKYPYMDLTRVGIFGTSAGGYNAAHALIAHPEFYKVAVSISGNHDHRTDKVWWNELWMGYPIGPQYAEQSNVVNAAKLQGHLLLVHGEMDDNVNPSASTMQFVNALIKANKDFDMLYVPMAGHGGGVYVQRKQWDYFTRHLLGVEPPPEYAMRSAGSGCTITIRNMLDKPVAIYWVSSDRRLTKYHDLQPGQTVQQNTYYGHEWEAHIDGKPVSWFAASKGALEWTITKG